jgi:hypothetical protein
VNCHYHCDYFVHYYNKTFESGGQSGQVGEIILLLLKSAIKEVHKNSSMRVQFVADTDEGFEHEEREHLQSIFEYNARPSNHTTSNGVDTNPYFITNPKITKSMKSKEVFLNILKMWHSQTKVWQLMEKYEAIAVNDDSHKHLQELRKGDYQDYHDVHAKYCYGLLWWSGTHRLSSHTYVWSLVSTLSSTYLPC